MDNDQRVVLLHGEHLQRSPRVIVAQEQKANPRVVLLDDPVDHDGIRDDLTYTRLADLVPAGRLSELDPHDTIIVQQ